MSSQPERIVKLRVKKCGCCGKSLKGVRRKGYDKRQEIEIPPIETITTEYQKVYFLDYET